MLVRAMICIVGIALPTIVAHAGPSPLWEACTSGQEQPDGKIKSCTAVIESAKISQTDRTIALNNRGGAWLDKGNLIVLGNPRREFEHAIADFTEAIRLNPKFRDAYLNRGYAWYSARDWNRAIADYTAAINIDPNYARSYQLRLELYRGQGDYAWAIGDTTQLIRLEANNAELYYDRGLLRREAGDPERAISDFTQAVKLNPKSGRAAAALARLMWDRGELDRALIVYNDAIAADPDSDGMFAERGSLLFVRGEFGAAASDFDKAIRLTPSHALNALRAPFRYVSRVRAGQQANAELEALVAHYKRLNFDIPPVFELYLGRTTPEAVLKAAGDSPRKRCEADFLVGLWQLIGHQHEVARQQLQAAAHGRCAEIDPTYRVAVVELKRTKP